MFDKLENVEKCYEELNTKISDPEVIADQNEWKKLMKEHSDITPVVEKYREYKSAKASEEELKELLNDKEMHDLAQEELNELKEKLPKIEEELKFLLVPKINKTECMKNINEKKKSNLISKVTEKYNSTMDQMIQEIAYRPFDIKYVYYEYLEKIFKDHDKDYVPYTEEHEKLFEILNKRYKHE